MDKITYNDFILLAGYKKPHYLMRLTCSFYGQDGLMYQIWAKMKLFWYILFFIPVHIAKLFYVLWDGGLRDFEIEPRWISTYHVDKTSDRYKKWTAQ